METSFPGSRDIGATAWTRGAGPVEHRGRNGRRQSGWPPVRLGRDRRDPGRYDTFEDLYRALWPQAVRLAWMLSGSRETAEDLVHDAFLRIEAIWQELDDPVPYFRRMVINVVHAEHRHSDVERRHRPQPPGPAIDPELEEVWNVVAQLPDRGGPRSSCASTST